MLKLNVDRLGQALSICDAFQTVGRLRSARHLLTANLPAVIGDLCRVQSTRGPGQLAEVIGFDQGVAQILPFEAVSGLQRDARVVSLHTQRRIPVGRLLLGRVLDGLARPIDGRGPLRCRRWINPVSRSPAALDRPRVQHPFITGQRVIDGMLTCGRGQRVGLFAGSGVGKSTLLGEIAKGAQSDMNVIALIGERGREVRPFLDDCLGPEGIQKSVTIISTADETPLMRVRAAETAVTLAAAFRAEGAHVLLMLDSMTRVAVAQREIGIQLGEPPSARGYTPSVFQLLSHLLEQLGSTETGTVTGIVSVLVDGDDMDEPISDAVRSIVDGHFVLDRKLAEMGHFPAIDVGRSVSRVFLDVTRPEHRQAAGTLRAMLATHNEVADLIRIGAYVHGSSAEVDAAIKLMPVLKTFLRQNIGEHARLEDTVAALRQIAAAWPYWKGSEGV